MDAAARSREVLQIAELHLANPTMGSREMAKRLTAQAQAQAQSSQLENANPTSSVSASHVQNVRRRMMWLEKEEAQKHANDENFDLVVNNNRLHQPIDEDDDDDGAKAKAKTKTRQRRMDEKIAAIVRVMEDLDNKKEPSAAANADAPDADAPAEVPAPVAARQARREFAPFHKLEMSEEDASKFGMYALLATVEALEGLQEVKAIAEAPSIAKAPSMPPAPAPEVAAPKTAAAPVFDDSEAAFQTKEGEEEDQDEEEEVDDDIVVGRACRCSII